MTVFWDVVPCSLVNFTGVSEVLTALNITLMMEAASTSETSANFYQTTRRNIPEDSHLHTRRREQLKSQEDDSSIELMKWKWRGKSLTCFKKTVL
jgi:mannose/fructose-specific phosphotransferase system component IIA